MFENVKHSLNEIIEIADKCPEKYQAKCFEILLDSLVRGQTVLSPAAAASSEISAGIGDTLETDIFNKNGITEEEWTNVFHIDGTSCEIIVSDLKEDTKTKKQIKLGLLLGFRGLVEIGKANLSKDSLIALCKSHVAFDSGNFAGTMKKHNKLFLQKEGGWTLTVPGRTEAVKVIKELAS